MNIYQFDMFEPELDRVDLLELELKALKESQNKIRRSLFSRLDALSKLYVELKQERESK